MTSIVFYFDYPTFMPLEYDELKNIIFMVSTFSRNDSDFELDVIAQEIDTL